jgi:hypothetical protein
MERNDQLGIAMLGANADKVLALIQAGFFDMKNGSLTVHFDIQGKLRKIEKNIVFNVIDAG